MATVILQARVGSTRLPGKALMTILGKPMLWYTIETLKRSPVVDRIVMAIPDNPGDDALVRVGEGCGIEVFRGSEENVLQRFYGAALAFPDDVYFRATGDNPIIDWGNPGRSLDYLLSNDLDYVLERGMPLGAVVEVFTFGALERAFREGSSAEDIEHVTWYIKKSGGFRVGYIDAPEGLRFPGLRLTVDYPEDFERVRGIIEHLYKKGIPDFEEVISYVNK
ncbi:MAG: acylneuraminate cytidylyltransferase [bacterium]|nr:acylneuraminate cytidylyltransferase [bacterium]